jgi:hypothetical protein
MKYKDNAMTKPSKTPKTKAATPETLDEQQLDTAVGGAAYAPAPPPSVGGTNPIGGIGKPKGGAVCPC